MIRVLKVGKTIYRNFNPKVVKPVAFDEQGNPVQFEESYALQELSNENIAKGYFKDTLSWFTDFYIQQKLSEIDEDLADITSEAQVIEGRILYIAAQEGIAITTDEVKQKIALFVAGAYTQEQAIEDLKAKGLSDESVQKILPLLARAVEIARIFNWKEEIWDKEGELESQIDSMNLEELLQLDVKKLCEDTYSEIPLEV
ncbi:hypothetical protein [Desulfurobacterium crinifex]